MRVCEEGESGGEGGVARGEGGGGEGERGVRVGMRVEVEVGLQVEVRGGWCGVAGGGAGTHRQDGSRCCRA